MSCYTIYCYSFANKIKIPVMKYALQHHHSLLTTGEVETALIASQSTFQWLPNGVLKTVTKVLPAIRFDGGEKRSNTKNFFNSVVAAFTGKYYDNYFLYCCCYYYHYYHYYYYYYYCHYYYYCYHHNYYRVILSCH